MNKINFATGKTYTLSEIFSEDRKIIIPDLQRDYCWGDNVHQSDSGVIELVSGFVDNVIELSKEESQTNQFGLLYGYESPQNHIQLCDGQQRITTLFLLIGVLNKLSSDNKYRQYLISDFEYFNDDREPYLQYSIRESSLYFLSDLICHYFVKANDDNSYVEKFSDIKSCSWYYSEYNSDPSIQSMLKAIEIIESKLDDKVNKDKLADCVLKHITFMYYDMGNRKNGEETFVVINLAGEPLSANQNLKPRIIAAKINEKSENIAQRWEEIETWFWRNRDKELHDTADAGFNEFLHWVAIIKTEKEDFCVEKISFNDIYKYWEAVKYLFEESELKDILDKHWLSPKEKLTLDDQFKLLPLIVYCTKFKISDLEERDCLRVYRYFENIARYESPSQDNHYVNRAIKTVKLMPNKDIVSILDLKNDEEKKRLLPEEEELKLQILKSSKCRKDTEKAFWEMQSFDIDSHRIWMGRITTIINWATDNNVFDIDNFKKYCSILNNVFVGNCDNNINLTRRALLTRGLNNYPMGGTRFCWERKDWYELIVDNQNQEEFKLFLDELMNSSNMKEAQEKMCENNPAGKRFDEFVKCPYLLEYSNNNKHIIHENNGYYLCKSSRAEKFGVMTAHLLHSLGATWENDFNKWKEYQRNWQICYTRSYDGLVVIQDNSSTEGYYLDIACCNNSLNICLKQRNGQISLSEKPDGFKEKEGVYFFSKELSEVAKSELNFKEEKNIIYEIICFINNTNKQQ